jgi:hypothetical protein
MTVIAVPRPRPSAINQDRPVNALLQSQIQHLRDAERNLPLRYQTQIYVNAIRTEGEAARYIRAVTEAIHKAHAEAAAQRALPAIRRKLGIDIAAAAQEPARGRPSAAKRKSKTTKRRRRS